MNIFRISLLVFIFSISSSCQFDKKTDLSITIDGELEKALINEIVDSWHRAASTADSITYFNIMASEQSVFQGTDDSERWTKGEFRKWSRKYFQSGSAWTFVPKNRRNINIREGVAWFDEQLDSEHMGRCRGNGVLVKIQGDWKIDHYTLSLPIPNQVADQIIELIGDLEDES
jgi:hypothetical protein|tara:strand:+ start:55555 stop:56073 length:519 start_codon:yes stop_codon:yes gene_type:complete